VNRWLASINSCGGAVCSCDTMIEQPVVVRSSASWGDCVGDSLDCLEGEVRVRTDLENRKELVQLNDRVAV
jgi:hypothetical protein